MTEARQKAIERMRELVEFAKQQQDAELERDLRKVVDLLEGKQGSRVAHPRSNGRMVNTRGPLQSGRP